MMGFGTFSLAIILLILWLIAVMRKKMASAPGDPSDVLNSAANTDSSMIRSELSSCGSVLRVTAHGSSGKVLRR